MLVRRLIVLLSMAAVAVGAQSPADAASHGLHPSAVMSAKVPSLCGYAPGRLVDGSLPGVAPGEVTVRTVRLGALDRRSGRDAAAVVRCNRGGVAWPEVVVIYTASRSGKPVLRGAVDLGRVGGGIRRETVTGISIKRHTVKVRFSTGYADDCGACGSAAGSATIGLRKGRVKVLKRSVYGYREAARSLVAAYNGRAWKKVRAFTSDAGQYRALKEYRASQGSMKRPTCLYEQSPDPAGPFAPTCAAQVTGPRAELSGITWTFAQDAAHRWKIVELYGYV